MPLNLTSGENSTQSTGVIAIAVAVALSCNIDPSTVTFCDDAQLPQHLVQCLQRKLLTPFPTSKQLLTYKTIKPKQIEVFCLCRTPWFQDEDHDPDNIMVKCTKCRDWYHVRHHNPPIPQSAINNKREKWICSDCVPPSSPGKPFLKCIYIISFILKHHYSFFICLKHLISVTKQLHPVTYRNNNSIRVLGIVNFFFYILLISALMFVLLLQCVIIRKTKENSNLTASMSFLLIRQM